MTLIQKKNEAKEGHMESPKDNNAKSSRPVRSKRHTRRSLVVGQRPQKRLFTPDIKRYLKDWLVRRRENPYPNREEKRYLSQETGLTYIQVCNWFANWRRKLKNVNAERNQPTWGHLIRTYNDRAHGNVEQFSICSEDSIWSEPAPTSSDLEYDDEIIEQRESQQDSDSSSLSTEKCNFNNNFYKIETKNNPNDKSSANVTSPLLLSKWLESAARFQPSESNYSWWADGRRKRPQSKFRMTLNTMARHDKDEVEAAVALTALASSTNCLIAP